MFDVALIDGDIEFSMKAFRTLKGAKNFANKLMEQTSEWVLFHSVKLYMRKNTQS